MKKPTRSLLRTSLFATMATLLLCPSLTQAQSFSIGNRVQAIGGNTIRSSAAGADTGWLTVAGRQGTIAGSPTYAYLASTAKWYWWYNVNWDSTSQDGWSIEASMTAIVNQSPHAVSGYQRRSDTGVSVSPGGTIPQGVGVNLGATVTDPDAGDTIRIEVEIHQLPATFTGTANYFSSYVSSGSVASIPTITGLAAGNYGWRYRAVDNHGLPTNWVLEKNPDFIVQGATTVTLTLYVHDGSASGSLLTSARVTGSDGAGINFDKTTSSGGYVTIAGTPGTWSFSASKSGYSPNNWNQSITVTSERHAFLTPNISQTRIISLSGNLSFGSVPFGTATTRTLTISNTGNTPLNVSSITYPSGFSGSWNGSIAAGTSHDVTVTFAPSSATTYDGSVTVNSDATSGANTINISGMGTSVQNPTTYTVTYSANGATSGTVPGPQTKTQGATLTLAANSGNLTKTGYTFAGWNTTANGSGTDYAAGGSYTANESVTLYAKWTVLGTPSISSVNPSPVIGANSPQVITINGANFVDKPTLILTWPGQTGYTIPASSVTFVNSSQLRMSIVTGTDPSAWTVKARNPDNQLSNVFGFQVNAPAPTITSISPTSAGAGSGSISLTVNGTTFQSASIVKANGNSLATTAQITLGGLVTSLSATLPSSYLASAGTVTITVYSPAPGGGMSAAATFTVTGGQPTAPTISTSASLPDGMQATAYNQTLTATGGSAPYSWSLFSGSLPSGLRLSSGGTISGTPTTPMTATFAVQVTGANSMPSTKSFSLTIRGPTVPGDPPITEDFIPEGRNNRPKNPLTASYITIHDTGNSAPRANASMHAMYVKNPDTGFDAEGNPLPNNPIWPKSWHFTVDDGEVYQHLPLTEEGYHAGNVTGNRQSIGIEICVNSDGNMAQAEKNAAWLTARLLTDNNLSLDRVKQHNFWSGKDCPRQLRARSGGWEGFLACVGSFINGTPPSRLFIVTPSSGVNGSLIPSTQQIVPIMEKVLFTASPSTASGASQMVRTLNAGNDYVVDQWFVNGIPAQTGGTNFTLVNVTADTDVQVTFRTAPVAAYTVTPSAGENGGISPSSQLSVVSGSNLTFTAMPFTGYVVDQWLLNDVPVQTGGVLYELPSVSSPASITVTFKAAPVDAYAITTVPFPSYGGTATGGGAFAPGSQQTVSATANPGYNFINWTENGIEVSASASYAFTLTASRSLVANFTATAFILSDKDAPALLVTQPYATGVVSTEASSINLVGTASDLGHGNNGISSVAVNGVDIAGASTANGGTANWSLTAALTEGMNVFSVVAKDGANNTTSTRLEVVRLLLPDSPGPVWWVEYNVLNANDPADSYAAANIGQLKYMAKKAYLAMETYLPGGAGATITALINGFTNADNYVAANAGQLKYVAKPFYDRLGLAYPWSAGSDDYAVVNVGQLKKVFSFEVQ